MTKKQDNLNHEDKDSFPGALLHKMDAYWRAANYLSVGQIYLYDNPLLKRPLALADVKTAVRPLGHHPRTELHLRTLEPGHQNIRLRHDLRLRPWTRRPSRRGQHVSRGNVQRNHPNISQDEAGLRKLFLQFSFPGGIPSHASPECPGSIHEGGELGYSLSHAFGGRIEKLVGMPGSGQRSGFCLAIADDAGDDLDRDCRTPPRTDG